LFGWIVSFRRSTPIEEIRRLRAEGLSLVKVAEEAGVSVSVVSRVVGKLGTKQQDQQEIALQIDQEPVSWHEKVERWKQQTGMSETTFWRVLNGSKSRHGK
jgi:hypothetical protein